MIARHNRDERFFLHQLEYQVGVCLMPQERYIQRSVLKILRQRGREAAGNLDLGVEQLIPEQTCRTRKPVGFMPDQNADSEARFGGDAARRAESVANCACASVSFACSRNACPAALNTTPCTPRVISGTPTSRSRSRIWRLSDGCRVQPFLCGRRQAACLGNRDEVAEMP
jgi:hypothetical protein